MYIKELTMISQNDKEIEALGRRLDTARRKFQEGHNEWTLNYWSEVIDQLTRRWHATASVNQGQALAPNQTWTVSHDYLDHDNGLVPDPVSRMISGFFDRSLNDSWNREIDRRLMGQNR